MVLGPGCCGFAGPVPSATLDKRCWLSSEQIVAKGLHFSQYRARKKLRRGSPICLWNIGAANGPGKLLQLCLQLRVFRFGLLEDRDIGIGVLPQRQKILIRGLRLGVLARERVGAAKPQMRESRSG